MNLSDLGAVGELVGSLGVIVSLVYLSTQIRQNTRSVQAASYQTVIEGVNQVNRLLISEDGLPGLVVRGQRDFGGLDPEERVRFSAFLGHVITNHEIALHLHERGLLDADSFEAHRVSVVSALRAPGAQLWWRQAQSTMNRSLRAHLNTELEREPTKPL